MAPEAGSRAAGPPHPPNLASAIAAVRAVGREGTGNVAASRAWKVLSHVDVTRLPEILAGMDGAGPLADNWLRAAVDTVAEHTLARGGKLPLDRLEAFLHDRSHSPRPRRLAYEWITRVDPEATDRLLAGMLDDPSLELRRDAVARVLDAAANASGSKAKTLYRKALDAARDLDQVKASIAALGKLGEPIELARHLGFIADWHLIGPFDNTGQRGFAAVYPPEREVDLDAVYPGKSGPVRWRTCHTDDSLGVVDLNKVVGKYKGVIMYAAAELILDKDQRVQLRLGSINACKVWANGVLAGAYETYHTITDADQYISTVRLRRGRNLILLKVCQNEQEDAWAERWEFQLRVTDLTGAAVQARRRPDGG